MQHQINQAKAHIICPSCSSKNIVKKGKRKRKFREIQQFQCKDCNKFFLSEKQEKTYSLKIILSSISNYNLGYKLNQVSNLIKSRYKLSIPISTVSSWINEYKESCTFNKLRDKAIKLYKPKSIIKKQTLNHIQPYTFKYHKAKLHLLFHSILYNNQFHNIAHFYEPLKAYLKKIPTKTFPHHIFTYNKNISSRPNAEIEKNNFINETFNTINNQGNIGIGQLNSATEIAKNNDLIENKNSGNFGKGQNEQRAFQIQGLVL